MKTLLTFAGLFICNLTFGQVRIFVSNGCMTFYPIGNNSGPCVQLDKIISFEANTANTEVTVKRTDNQTIYLATNIRDSSGVAYSSSADIVRNTLQSLLDNARKQIIMSSVVGIIARPRNSSGNTPIVVSANTAYFIDIAPIAGATYTITTSAGTTQATSNFFYLDGKGGKLTEQYTITPVSGVLQYTIGQ